MDRDEERTLREIERSLERDDPEFARRIRTTGNAGARRLARFAIRIALAGAVIAVVGLWLGSALGGVGVLAAVVGVALRLAAPVFTQPEPLPGDDEGDTRHDGVPT
ncbi:hypothetical protein GCM10011609_86970 [Lentzea pudingi]|uniref:DUF3040 domain-containing protein n=1 Tax=Lentzea pudingi TaxID=1789439 RepID=A0ABQ2IT36_9PSEU|nr:DUF3040 domain-containing protein [Lentzea pudingi]GGN29735.1 hypothetical protein GCM10011609_86970 [Lentzea pudingi]